MMKSLRQSVVSINDGFGTGFWINETDLITCKHVIDDCEDLHLYMPGEWREHLTAKYKVVAEDSNLDISVVRIQNLTSVFDFQPLSFTLSHERNSLVMFGFPMKANLGKLSYPKSTGNINISNNNFQITFDSAPLLGGGSGSPILNENEKAVIGVAIESIDVNYSEYGILEGRAISSSSIIKLLDIKNIPYEVLNLEPSYNSFIFTRGFQLNVTDLLGVRASKMSGYRDDIYLTRSIDNKLKSLIENNGKVIIYGKALSGKSRLVYNTIEQNFRESYVAYIKRPEYIDKNSIIELNALIQENINSGNRVVFVIDDVDDYVELDFFDEIIERILGQENVSLVVTCRKVKIDYLDRNFYKYADFFSKITIPQLEDDEIARLTSFIDVSNTSLEPDDTIGSYFLPTSEMRNRYKSLSIEDKEFLRCYKITSILHRESRGAKDVIKGYFDKRADSYYENKDMRLTNFKYDSIIDILVKSQFVKLAENKRVLVETSYLNSIIEVDLSEKQIAKEVIEYYGDNEEFYSKLISRVENDSVAEYVFRELINSSVSDSYIFSLNCLVNRMPTSQTATKALIRSCDEYTLKPDTISINTILSKSTSFTESLDVIKLFDTYKGLEPDPVTWFTIIKPSFNVTVEDFEVLYQFARKFDESELPLLLNAFISFSPDESTSYSIYKKFDNLNVERDDATIFSLLKHAESPSILKEIIEDASNIGIEFDSKFVQSLFYHLNTDDNEAAVEFVNLLIEKEVNISSFGLSKVIKTFTKYSDAVAFIKSLPRDKIEIRSIVINELLKVCKNISERKLVFEFSLECGLSININQLNITLQRIKNYRKAKDFFKNYYKDIVPDSYTFSHLISLSPTFNEAKNNYEKSKYNGIVVSELLLNILLTKVRPNEKSSYNTVEYVYNEYKANVKVLPTSRFLWMLLSKSRSWEQSLRIYQNLIGPDSIRPVIYNILLKCANNKQQASFVYKELLSKNIKPTVQNLNLILRHENDLDSKWDVYNEIIKLGLQPNMATFNYFLDNIKFIHDDDLIEILDELLNEDAIKHTHKNEELIKNVNGFCKKYFKRTKDVHGAIDDYGELRKIGLEPNDEALLSILRNVKFKDELDEIEELFLKEGMAKSEELVVAKIKFEKNIDIAYNLAVEYYKKYELRSSRICNYLIRKSDAKDVVIDVFIKYCLETSITIDEILFNRLIIVLEKNIPLIFEVLSKINSDFKKSSIEDIENLVQRPSSILNFGSKNDNN